MESDLTQQPAGAAEAEEQLALEPAAAPPLGDEDLGAAIEAIVYVTEEPVMAAQIAAALQQPEDRVQSALDALAARYGEPCHGIAIRQVAGGYKMTTKPEHHEAIRTFAKSLKPPLKLSLAALETLATIAYKQPVTGPEIMEIRGVQGAGVLKTLLDRKLIVTSGRKNVIGRPILYKTSKDFLVQFGLRDLSELPTLKEFEELRRLAASEPEEAPELPLAEQPSVPAAPAAEQLAAGTEDGVPVVAAEAPEAEQPSVPGEDASVPDVEGAAPPADGESDA